MLVEIGNLILKFTGKCKEHRRAKTTLKKKEVGELTLPDFKIYHQSTVNKTKTVWYWCKDRKIDVTEYGVQK